MPPKQHAILAACTDDVVYCRVEGQGNMHNCPPLRDFTDEMVAEGYGKIVVDLELCTGMDSTFMGTMLGMSTLTDGDGQPVQVMVINCSESNRKLLSGLGVDQFVRMRSAPLSPPDVELVDLAQSEGGDYLETVYQAHRHLADIDKKNAQLFGQFLKTLEEELS